MSLMQDILNITGSNAKSVLMYGGFFAGLEILLKSERQSFWASRLKGIVGWGFYVVFSSLFWISIVKYIPNKPLVHLDFSKAEPWSLMGIVAPFIGILVFDFFYYWFHRCQHKLPFLWKFHAVHHSIQELNAINCYHHWLEDVFRIPFILIPLHYLIGVGTGTPLLLITLLTQGWGFWIHTNTKLSFGRFRIIFADNQFHRLHHSINPNHYDRNFAAFFPVWDALFQTLKLPKKGEEFKTGIIGSKQKLFP